MEIKRAIPAIWVYTTGDSFNKAPAAWGSFLTPAQQARLERIRQGTLLFDGRHREYYLTEERTQFEFPNVRVGTRMIQMYLTQNVLGLISLKGADLLFGEEPLLRADDDFQQGQLAALIERSNLHALFYSAAVDASYQCECFLEACIKGGEVYLHQVPADEIFPVGELGPDLQYPAYVRYEIHNVGAEARPVWLLLETTYRPGAIERHAFQLGDNGTKSFEVKLDQWPLPPGMAPLVPMFATGIDRNTVTWIPNLLVRRRPIGDYDGAIDLQDTLNAKNTQVGRVLLKHSDPKIAFPVESFDETGSVRSDYEAFPFTDKEKIPQYIVWDAELEHAMADRAFTLNQLLVRTETSPVLLGLKDGSAPDAYKKVRLESFNSLTKAQRKAAYWKAGIRRAVSVAQDLENTIEGVQYDRGPIAVQLRDGIPVDANERAEEISLLRSASVISLRRAIQMQLEDPAAVDKEESQIKEERAAAMPSILMDEPRATPPATEDQEVAHAA